MRIESKMWNKYDAKTNYSGYLVFFKWQILSDSVVRVKYLYTFFISMWKYQRKSASFYQFLTLFIYVTETISGLKCN